MRRIPNLQTRNEVNFSTPCFNCFCFNKKGTKRTDFYGQSISHKLENAKRKKKIKCIPIGFSLRKPLKCFKNIKIEVSKKKEQVNRREWFYILKYVS